MKTKAEKWDMFVKGINWLGNPDPEILIREHYAMAQGNHEKYLKLAKLKEKITCFFDQEADPSPVTDYAEAYATLGVVKGLLENEPTRNDVEESARTMVAEFICNIVQSGHHIEALTNMDLSDDRFIEDLDVLGLFGLNPILHKILVVNKQ